MSTRLDELAVAIEREVDGCMRSMLRNWRRNHWTPTAGNPPCSWCHGDGFQGIVPCRECESTGWELERR